VLSDFVNIVLDQRDFCDIRGKLNGIFRRTQLFGREIEANHSQV